MRITYEKLKSVAPSPSDLVPDVPSDLDARCAALLRREPEARPKGAAVVAWLGGKAQPGPLLAVSTASLHPVFVGRSHELSVLRDALAELPTTGASHLCVHGESGIGKSALVRRFAEEATATGVVVLAGRCYEREEVPYEAVDGRIDVEPIGRDLVATSIVREADGHPLFIDELVRHRPARPHRARSGGGVAWRRTRPLAPGRARGRGPDRAPDRVVGPAAPGLAARLRRARGGPRRRGRRGVRGSRTRPRRRRPPSARRRSADP